MCNDVKAHFGEAKHHGKSKILTEIKKIHELEFHFELIGLPWLFIWKRIHLQCRRPGFDPWVRSLGWEDPLEKGTATHSNILAGQFHGLYSPWGCKESDTTE